MNFHIGGSGRDFGLVRRTVKFITMPEGYYYYYIRDILLLQGGEDQQESRQSCQGHRSDELQRVFSCNHIEKLYHFVCISFLYRPVTSEVRTELVKVRRGRDSTYKPTRKTEKTALRQTWKRNTTRVDYIEVAVISSGSDTEGNVIDS